MERRNELKDWFWELKTTLSCHDCGLSFKDRPECCDFHHLDPQVKTDLIYVLIHSSKKAALTEIEKCVPLCANCHRTRHKDYFRYWKQKEIDTE